MKLKPLFALIFGVALAFGQTTPKLLLSLPVKTDVSIPYVDLWGETIYYDWSGTADNPIVSELYATNQTQLIVFNEKSWKVKKTISLSTPPLFGQIVVNPSSGLLVMVSEDFNLGQTGTLAPKLTIIDPVTETKTMIPSIDPGITNVHNWAFSNDGTILYVTSGGEGYWTETLPKVFALSTSTWKTLASWTTGVMQPWSIVVLPNGKVYLPMRSYGNNLLTPSPTPGASLYGPPGQIAIIDTNGTMTTQNLDFAPETSGLSPNGLLYMPSWTATQTKNSLGEPSMSFGTGPLLVVNTETAKLMRTFEFDLPIPNFFAFPSTQNPLFVYGGISYWDGMGPPYNDQGETAGINLTDGSVVSWVGPFVPVYGLTAHQQADGTDIIVVLNKNTLNVYQGLEPAIATPEPVINENGIVDSGAYQPLVSPGDLASIFGAGFSAETASASAIPLPTSLAGVQVLANGILAPLLYVSPTQINFEMPTQVALGKANVQVVWETISSNIEEIKVNATSLAFITNNGVADITDMTGKPAGVSGNPIVNNQLYIGWGMGFGSTTCNLPDGTAATDASCVTLAKPTLKIGNETAKILFSGLAPGFVGLYQINFELFAFSSETTSSSPSVVTGTLTAGGATSTFHVLATQ